MGMSELLPVLCLQALQPPHDVASESELAMHAVDEVAELKESCHNQSCELLLL